MISKWSSREANKFVKYYSKNNIEEDLALRIYSTRLLGKNPNLVLHGGGNTSLKSKISDSENNLINIIYIKGSGWNMDSMEPFGMPAVKLDPLSKLEFLENLSDEEMVNKFRESLINFNSPNPSVETLLHAFLPHKYIDHTHANAILSITGQDKALEIISEIYGDTVGIIPYVMPGFQLAKVCSSIYKNNTNIDGMILLKHGIFSFGKSARTSYENMIQLVTKAENFIKKGKKSFFTCNKSDLKFINKQNIATTLRGILSEKFGDKKRLVLSLRNNKVCKDFAFGREVSRYANQGTVTPDHAIRIKSKPLILKSNFSNNKIDFLKQSKIALKKYIIEYESYFLRNNNRVSLTRKQLDPLPRMIVVPGIGVYAVAEDSEKLKIVEDLIDCYCSVIMDAERIGNFKSISKKDIFDIEYWPLEQAKLSSKKVKALSGYIVVITGGAGEIGKATARVFKQEGAEVILLDINSEKLEKISDELNAYSFVCDVRKKKDIDETFNKIVNMYGGLDVLVSNAGSSWQGRIGDVAEKVLNNSFDLNFYSHQRVSQKAIKIMRNQKLGGSLLYNISKQALNPGLDFGPYGIAKTSTLALMRQYAVDHGHENIRANAVNADRIQSGLLTKKMISIRAQKRGLNPQDYMKGNLLKREVKAYDVAQAFLYLSQAESTTAAVISVDGGNIAAAVR